jgi:hypothetical protein
VVRRRMATPKKSDINLKIQYAKIGEGIIDGIFDATHFHLVQT